MAAEGDDRSGGMTLAFELDAIRRFADPERVFADAREWSRDVGVASNDSDAVAAFVADRDLTQDFDLDERDIWLTMEEIRESRDTPRYVFVGTTAEDRRIADATGWEFRRPDEVAEAAGWSLDEIDEEGTGLLDRLRTRFSEAFGGSTDG